jgi:hypothetical protein
MTTLNEFVEGVAKAIDTSCDIILADGDHPVSIIWAPSTEPDRILVNDYDGAVWQLTVQRLTDAP